MQSSFYLLQFFFFSADAKSNRRRPTKIVGKQKLYRNSWIKGGGKKKKVKICTWKFLWIQDSFYIKTVIGGNSLTHIFSYIHFKKYIYEFISNVHKQNVSWNHKINYMGYVWILSFFFKERRTNLIWVFSKRRT